MEEEAGRALQEEGFGRQETGTHHPHSPGLARGARLPRPGVALPATCAGAELGEAAPGHSTAHVVFPAFRLSLD